MLCLQRLSLLLGLLLPCVTAYSTTTTALSAARFSAPGKTTYLDVISDGSAFTYTLPPHTTFFHMVNPYGAVCTAPAVGDNGVIDCAAGLNTIYVFLSVAADTPPGTILTHTVTTSEGATVTTTSVAEPLPNLNIVSTFPSSFVAGTSPTYTVTMTNQGPATTGPLSVSDDLILDGLSAQIPAVKQLTGPPVKCQLLGYGVTCDIPSLNQGDSVQLAVTVNTFPAGKSLEHRITTLYADYGYSDDLYETATEIMVGDLVVSSSAPPQAGPNDDIPYSIILSSPGPSAVANVTYSWTTPPGTTFLSIDNPTPTRLGETELTKCTTPVAGSAGTVTCTTDYLYPASTLAPGVSVGATISAITIHVRAPGAQGTVTNSVSGTADYDSNPSNNTSSATTTILSGPVADLSLMMWTSSASAVIGTRVTYTASVSNAGPSDVKNVRMTFTAPSGAILTSWPEACTQTSPAVCTVTTLAKGGTAKFDLGFTGTTTGTMTSNGSVSSDALEIDSSNNNASASCAFTPYRSDLRLFASATPPDATSPIVVGDLVSYHVFISPLGPDPVTAVTTLTFPPGLQIISAQSPCVVAGGTVTCATTIPPTEGPSFEVWCRVTAAGTYTTPVVVTTSDFDPDLSNNSVNVTITANATQPPPPPGLAISIDPTSMVAVPGVPVAFTIHVSNTSAAPLTNVDVIDSFPAGLSLLSAEPSAGICPPGGPLLCYGGTLAAGATTTIRIVALPPDSGSVTNQASVSSNGVKTAVAHVTIAVVPTDRRHAAGH